MEENRQDNLHTEEQENNKTVSRQTRHTWIGDADEIRPEQINRTVTRMTAVWPENDGRSTRLVEKQRKAYKGFITDEEVREAETQAEEGRKARAADRAAREELAQTRIYTGLGSGLEVDDTEDKQSARPPRRKRTYTIAVPSGGRLKALIAIAAVLVLLLAFEIGFVFMKSSAAKLPGETEDIRKQTAGLQDDNKKLQKKAEELGDYDQVKELRDSWQRLIERIEE